MNSDEQLRLWVEGTSVHNDSRDECCPDFSCCRPELKADVVIRKAFQAATKESRHKMLMVFLGEAMAGKKVYITNGDPVVD